MDSTLSIILITIVIVFVVFLILREVNCWYWKINERVNLQYKEVDGLSQILKELKKLNQGLNVNDDFLEFHSNENVVAGENYKNDNQDIDEFSLSNNEKKRVREYIKSGLNPNEKLVINRYSREIKKINMKDLDNINKKEWIVIKIK
ncbi:MAG: hypothetical protein GXO79_02280 [Chlorobi bacterium]|nr:hypothetical protein [Chlorobiota bacterium]